MITGSKEVLCLFFAAITGLYAMRAPTPEELSAIAELLAEGGLPTDDLAEQDLSLYRIEVSGNGVVAVGGLERCGNTALIRSIATSASVRGRGIASEIVEELERISANEGFEDIFLITESAQRYFATKGYSLMDRDNVPHSIRKSRQFSSLCPNTASVMRKRVGGATNSS